MLRRSLSYFKFFFKVRIISVIRKFLLFCFGARPHHDSARKRILFINLEGLGDLIFMTGVLKHYPAHFPDSKIYLLFTEKAGLTKDILPPGITEIITLDYKKFTRNPWYGFRVISRLRKIGFGTVVNHDPSVAEIIGKMIALEIGAERIVGYEGPGIQFQKPFDSNMEHNVRFVEHSLYPHYTEIVPSVDRHADLSKRLPHFLRYYIAIFEHVTKSKAPMDVAPVIHINTAAETSARNLLRKGNIEPGSYCLLSLGTTSIQKEWPPERFAEAAQVLKERSIPIVIVDWRREPPLSKSFLEHYNGKVLDLTGQTSFAELTALIHLSRFTWSNDTGVTHLAVALKKPSLTILGIGHFGNLSLYGYPHLNRWVYEKIDCLCDNWHCMYTVGPNDPMPCIAVIEPEKVKRELTSLIDYLDAHPEASKGESFQIEFTES